jgi:hypothetical protein
MMGSTAKCAIKIRKIAICVNDFMGSVNDPLPG